MDYAKYEGTKLTISDFIIQHSEIGERKALEKLKRFGEKRVLYCPFCDENLIVRAGDQREVHFAHSKGQSCLISNAYDTYTGQIHREGKQHSTIRDLIYDELKNQEKVKKELKVDYGYVAKAKDQWKLLPDICLQTGSGEIAINIITNVHDIGDRKTVNLFSKRDRFFREKGMRVVWFVEDRELADDLENRIIHLWESEYTLAMKTEQDDVWDALLYELDEAHPIRVYEVMGYKAKGNLNIDVRSLYYVHTLENEIQFSVQRIIRDEKSSPYRSFAVNKGYRMSLSTALTISGTMLLSRPEQDEQDRVSFQEEYNSRKAELSSAAYPVSETASEAQKDDQPDDMDPVELVMKLKRFTIMEEEAYQLYTIVKKDKDSLSDYGLDINMIRQLAKDALGSIGHAKVRKWLVEME